MVIESWQKTMGFRKGNSYQKGIGFMREKTKKLVITFHTTTEAMAMETACRTSGIAGRLIPVPTEITAGCGLAWICPVQDMDQVVNFIKDKGISREGEYVLIC